MSLTVDGFIAQLTTIAIVALREAHPGQRCGNYLQVGFGFRPFGAAEGFFSTVFVDTRRTSGGFFFSPPDAVMKNLQFFQGQDSARAASDVHRSTCNSTGPPRREVCPADQKLAALKALQPLFRTHQTWLTIRKTRHPEDEKKNWGALKWGHFGPRFRPPTLRARAMGEVLDPGGATEPDADRKARWQKSVVVDLEARTETLPDTVLKKFAPRSRRICSDELYRIAFPGFGAIPPANPPSRTTRRFRPRRSVSINGRVFRWSFWKTTIHF